ncbi:protein FAM136A-like [Hippopotamus amphibius kiboko]|uniref:protein FAM136A-like n=1 Tax=Hippopotamus amphibius kiboko TaxID=575201 RepID=UPI0025970BB7|nr:protein FAM136A-like [Hippopotamus amphibius kiboko]
MLGSGVGPGMVRRLDPGSGDGGRPKHRSSCGRRRSREQCRVLMAELQQLRVQEVVDSMVKGLERENIRKMQGLTFRCSAGCCEDSQASVQQVHQCTERCHAPLAQAQALVTSELEKFQDHRAGCAMCCNGKARDSIDAGSKELPVKQQLESGVTKCVDDHMNPIPILTQRMKESLSSTGK